jgi:hypothetical protein
MALTQVQGGMLAGSSNTVTTIQSNGTTAITVDASQRVGIGISSPSAPLQVQANSSGIAVRVSGRSSDGYSDISLYNNANTVNNAFFGSSNTATFLGTGTTIPLTFQVNNTERMRIDSSGNFCVGTTSSPNAGTAISCFGGRYSLCLNSGSFNYYLGTESNNFNVYDGAGTLKGYLTSSGTWTNTSDIAFKKDIVDIKYSLQDALNLRPVSYVTKDYDEPQIGFIAQEVEQIIPEVVSGEDGSKGISYGSLVALCVKAIQELNAKVDAQALEIAALKATP